jgi:hypothetical protein
VVPSRTRRRVPWIRISVLVIATAFAAIALVRGQDVARVGLDGQIEFYSRGTSQVDENAVRRQQSEIEDRVSSLEQSARSESDNTGAQAGTANIAGAWAGGGASYTIEQYGTSAVIVEQSTYGVTAYGIGSVSGTQFSFEFEAFDGTTGTGELNLINNQRLVGQFTNYAVNKTVDAILTR